ncbi:MAG: hypothetical protein MJA83_11260 [Gammaproteobacteria bacterium]|nr:hypothetical protein [Gammaproteobacteria bacterium]
MWIKSGVVDQGIYFNAGQIGLSSFTVYRSRNNDTPAAMDTPTITEIDAANMPGLYFLLLDEDTTIDAGDLTQEMVLRITHDGMAPIVKTVTLFDDTDFTVKLVAGQNVNTTNVPDVNIKSIAGGADLAAAGPGGQQYG